MVDNPKLSGYKPGLFLEEKGRIYHFSPASLSFAACQGLMLPPTEPDLLTLNLLFLFSPPKSASHVFRSTRGLSNQLSSLWSETRSPSVPGPQMSLSVVWGGPFWVRGFVDPKMGTRTTEAHQGIRGLWVRKLRHGQSSSGPEGFHLRLVWYLRVFKAIFRQLPPLSRAGSVLVFLWDGGAQQRWRVAGGLGALRGPAAHPSRRDAGGAPEAALGVPAPARHHRPPEARPRRALRAHRRPHRGAGEATSSQRQGKREGERPPNHTRDTVSHRGGDTRQCHHRRGSGGAPLHWRGWI